jgi:hypothetical protein
MTSEHSGICASCIGNTKLKKWIRENGVMGTCEFEHSEERPRKVVTIKAFTEKVDELFKKLYGFYSDSDYYTGFEDPFNCGETLAWLIPNLIKSFNEDMLQILLHELWEIGGGYIGAIEGEFNFYDNKYQYEKLKVIQEREYQEEKDYREWEATTVDFQWSDFKEQAKYQNRFFKLKKKLDKLFGKKTDYKRGAKNSPLGTLKKRTLIYRARKINSIQDYKTIQKDPEKELGCPPKEKTVAGRMNVEFIPVFYGAFSKNTAITEVQPHKEELICVGEFTLLEDLKVFDFTANAEKKVATEGHSRYDRINEIESKISQPISPNTKVLDYIPTQIIAEYLREHFNVDAIIYRSSWFDDSEEGTKNIVIFDSSEKLSINKENVSVHRITKVEYKHDELLMKDLISPFSLYPEETNEEFKTIF